MKIKKLNENAQLPQKAHEADAGYDIFSIEDVTIPAGHRATVKTGIACEFPEDGNFYYMRIAPRSGMAVKHGINVLAGVVDQAYRGEILVCLHNTDLENDYVVKSGDKIAQMIPTIIGIFDSLEFVEEISETDRGDKGFGSSGK